MDYKRIQLKMDDDIAVLTLNHPEALNAISMRMLNELSNALGLIEEPENGIRCLLITGAGRGFCAGANLTDPDRDVAQERNLDDSQSLDTTYNPMFMRLRELRMPVVTAVNGPAAGVGMSLALMGDLVFAARSAYFYQAFRYVGLVPDGGATFILPRLVGLSRAMELSFLAEKLPAEKALDWGLITRVYDEDQLMPESLKVAKELAAGPTVSFGMMRRIYWESLDNTYEQQLHLESIMQIRANSTEDFAEGVMAFREKRPPVFKGK
ncbi:enoyl-CoA hydratase/isomerase [Thermodesulfobacteriota bacterium]